MGIWIRFNRLVKGFIHKGVVITFAQCIGHDTPVTEVQNRAQIEFVDQDPLIPFELGYISQPLLVRPICIELAVQKIFGNILGFLARLVQPWLLYFTVERISLARQIRNTRLSLTWMP